LAKVKIRGIEAIQSKIEKMFGDVRTGEQMRNEVGTFVVSKIQLEARRRKPLNDDRAFPELSPKSKGIRKYLGAYNILHPAFKADRSNLTLTGQLIDAITYRLNSTFFTIEVKNDSREPYLINKKLESSEPITNKQVDANVRALGFELYTASGIKSDPKVMRRIQSILKKYVRRAIKVNFGS
jgi:hypothetical protein